jgi:hypothetical protein
MNAFRRILTRHGVLALVAVAVTALPGCASSGSAGLTAKSEPGHYRTDKDYVAAVEHRARLRGVVVQWVNPPHEYGRNY